MSTIETEGSEAIAPDIEKKLLNLIADLDQFRTEKWFSRDINIFEAVGLQKQEIRHSNFLSYLLNPAQNHGLKDNFLRSLLQKATDRSETEKPFSALQIALADFSDAIVTREWRNIDILIESKSNKFIVAIENKIDSTEGQMQLETYEKTISHEYPNHATLLCYLTADGVPASRETWAAISYSDVISALQEARLRTPSLNAQAEMVIDHYIDLIRRRIVPDQALIDQCRRLYLLHKDALDLIIQHGQVNSFISATDTFFDKHPEIHKFSVRPSCAAFLPHQIYECVPPFAGINWWGQARPLAVWFNFFNDKIGIVFEVGPLADEQFSREEFVRSLQDYFQKRKTNITSTYTRVYSRYIKLADDSDAHELVSAMNSLYSEFATKHLNAVTTIAEQFFRKRVSRD